MKISLEWLKDYLPGELDAQKAADALMNAGLPVESIERVGEDKVIDVEVTSNRSDCLSHLGVARELAALMGRELKTGTGAVSSPSAASSVEIQANDLCPYYTARVITGIKVRPSPAWMVRRLEAVGLRAINNIVDVTNYLLFELGQPLHAFDYDKLEGRRIIVRRAVAGERLVSIDGKTRDLNPEMLVIADAMRPVALAGVMGGKDSEVSEGTTNILLESARFDPLTVRKTSRALALRSDSSYRFERGIDPTLADAASARAAQLIVETGGGVIGGFEGSGFRVQGSDKTVSLRVTRIAQVLGVEIPVDEAIDALERLRFGPVRNGGVIECTVPTWRLDVGIEVDLIEEIARLVGYQRIPMREAISIRLHPPQADLKAIELIRESLVASGHYEALTFSWVNDKLRDDFRPLEAAGLLRADESVRKDDAHLRPSILGGLLEAVRYNQTVGNSRARLFEIGSTFWTDAGGRIDERRRLAVVGGPELRELRGAVESMLETLDARREVKVVPDERPGFAKSACGRIDWGGRPIGWIGKIDRAIVAKLDLTEVATAAEIELAPLLAGMNRSPQIGALAQQPAVRRDLSLVVAEKVRYEQIESMVRELKLAWLEELRYVTTWRGKQVGEGNKSVTIELVFRADRTLVSTEVDEAVAKVVAAAKDKVGATLRT